MSDAFGNKETHELIIDNLGINAALEEPQNTMAHVPGRRNRREEPLMENWMDAAVWAKNPEGTEFQEINKDIVMANLNAEELDDVRAYGEMANELAAMGLHNDASFFRFKEFFHCSSSLSKMGFAHKLLTSSQKEIAFSGVPGAKPAQPAQAGEHKPIWKLW